MTALSIRDAVHGFLAARAKPWAHDRSQTIGASEIGQCARKVWFGKNGIAPDVADDLKGAAARGDLIEQYVWAPAVASHVASLGGELWFAGDEQKTLVDGYLSATPDG